jgi:TRAP-type transport system periplasmic protein
MKRTNFRLAVAAAVLCAAGISQANAQSGPVVLRAVTGWDKSVIFVDKYMDWIKRVNEKGAGRIRIDYTGGPEVFPSFEQLEPLKRGVVSTLVTSTGYVGALPELNATWLGFGATPAELRASGLVAALDKVIREKAGVTLLGFPLQMRFNVYLKRSLPDTGLTGFKLRTAPVYDPVLRGLGAVTVTVPPAELLTALETGLVDGFAWPSLAVVAPGYARAIKYKVTPAWWVGTDVALMNAAAYDKLSPDLQRLLVDTMIEIEKEVPAYYGGKEKAEDAALVKLGVQNLSTSEADLAKIRKLQWEGGVQTFLLKPSPKYGPQLVEVMKRFAPK